MEVSYEFLRRQIDGRKALIKSHSEMLVLLENKLERTKEQRKRLGLMRRIAVIKREIHIFHLRNNTLEVLLLQG